MSPLVRQFKSLHDPDVVIRLSASIAWRTRKKWFSVWKELALNEWVPWINARGVYGGGTDVRRTTNRNQVGVLRQTDGKRIGEREDATTGFVRNWLAK